MAARKNKSPKKTAPKASAKKNGAQLDDATIVKGVAALLKKNPGMSSSAALRTWRASGKPCAYPRWSAIYKQAVKLAKPKANAKSKAKAAK